MFWLYLMYVLSQMNHNCQTWSHTRPISLLMDLHHTLLSRLQFSKYIRRNWWKNIQIIYDIPCWRYFPIWMKLRTYVDLLKWSLCVPFYILICIYIYIHMAAPSTTAQDDKKALPSLPLPPPTHRQASVHQGIWENYIILGPYALF